MTQIWGESLTGKQIAQEYVASQIIGRRFLSLWLDFIALLVLFAPVALSRSPTVKQLGPVTAAVIVLAYFTILEGEVRADPWEVGYSNQDRSHNQEIHLEYHQAFHPDPLPLSRNQPDRGRRHTSRRYRGRVKVPHSALATSSRVPMSSRTTIWQLFRVMTSRLINRKSPIGLHE